MKTMTDKEILEEENKDPNGLCMEEIEALQPTRISIIRRLVRSWKRFRDVHLFPDSGPTPHSKEYIEKYTTGPGKRRGCYARERKGQRKSFKTKFQWAAMMNAQSREVKG